MSPPTSPLTDRVAAETSTYDSGVLTVTDRDGYPFSLRVRPRPANGGLQVEVPPGLPIAPGRAGLLCHEHDDDLWDLRNFVTLGELQRAGGRWTFRPERFLPGDGYMSFPRFALRGRRRAKNYLRSRGVDRPTIDWRHVRELRDRGRAGEDPNLEGPPWDRLPPEVEKVIRRFRTMELATISIDGTPQAWPVAPFYDPTTGQLSTASSIGLPGKPLRIRRSRKVAALFSNPTGSGLDDAPVVLVQGDAVAPDEILTPGTGFPDHMMLTVFGRQAPGIDLALQNAATRWLMDWYLMRLLIRITPVRILWWPHGDTSEHPRRLPQS